MSLDAHSRPPESLRQLFKKWQKSSSLEIDASNEILDFQRPITLSPDCVTAVSWDSGSTLVNAYSKFLNTQDYANPTCTETRVVQYEIKALPGLIVYPALLPASVQSKLLDKLLHRDLSVSVHKTNLHLHYNVQHGDPDDASPETSQPESFFEADPRAIFRPKDAAIHKPITIQQMLDRKLRWMTLGGQYDWTAKVYPSEKPPQFPRDISNLLQSIWPDIDAQAAIVNFYTPGDTLSVHRDVSEDCDRGLISISIGCDGLFIIGNQDGSRRATLRLRSGDAVLMSGESRFAWHAVPKILPNTCPANIQGWPADPERASLEIWRDWLKNKRINLNVRQMKVSLRLLPAPEPRPPDKAGT